MLNLTIQEIEGQQYFLFLYDTVLRIGAKDLMENPSAYEQVCSAHNVDIYLAKIDGLMGSREVNQYVLLIGSRADSEAVDLEDVGGFMHIAQLPETARGAVIASYDSETASLFRNMLSSFTYCETIDTNSTCYLPDSALMYLDESEQQAFKNSKKFNLNNFDMGSIVIQKDSTSEFSFMLPPYSDINVDATDCVSIDEMLRISAPYRIQERPNSKYEYEAKVHTPYWLNEPTNKFVYDMFPWLNGYSKSSLLPLQDNELALYKRLMDYVRGYTQRYISDILVGIYLSSANGIIVRKLLNIKPTGAESLTELLPVVKSLLVDVMTTLPEGLTCAFDVDSIDSYCSEDFLIGGKFSRDIGKSFSVSSQFLKSIIKEHMDSSRSRRIDVTRLGFMFDLSDSVKNEMLPILIDNGFIARPCYTYLYKLCETAYAIHWGHNGIACAVPSLIDKTPSNLEDYGNSVADVLNRVLLGIESKARSKNSNSSSDVFDFDDGDDAVIAYNHYIGDTNRKLIESGGDVDNSSTIANPADRVIERYRLIGGIDYLESFVSKIYNQVHSYGIIIETFIKLMRWGERKPQALVYPEHPEISDEFNLFEGIMVPNSHVFNDDDLIETNGCRYHLDSILVADSQIMRQDKPIVGFKLRQDYTNERYRYFVASWLDIGEMVVENKISVAELLAAYDISYQVETANTIEDVDAEYYASDSNIKQAFESNVKPEELNVCVKFYRNVLDSREYIQATSTEHPIGLSDRQFILLKKYVEALRVVYNNNEEKLKSISSTLDLLPIAKQVYEVYNSSGALVDHNQATASSTLSKLNLNYEYVDCELDGKFILLDDSKFLTSLNPIVFTDTKLSDLMTRSKRKIVLLMMERDDCFILCKKDIAVSEVRTKLNADGKNVIHMMEASKLTKAYDAILKGKVAYQGKPVKLHTSLKGVKLG